MKRIGILLLALHANTMLSNAWINQDLRNSINAQQEAYKGLDALKHLLRFDGPHISYSGNTRTSTYNFRGPREATSAFDAHKETYRLFGDNHIISTLGDGFMCGILLACIARSCKLRSFLDKESWKLLAPAVLALLGLAIKQSATMGSVNYFYLDHGISSSFSHSGQRPLIATVSKHGALRVVGHLFGLLCGCIVGALTTQYTLNRLSGGAQKQA